VKQAHLFGREPARDVVTDTEVDWLLGAGAPVAIGVSGGKDSCALGFAVVEFLDAGSRRSPRGSGRGSRRGSPITCSM
jgi:hypothetical protein